MKSSHLVYSALVLLITIGLLFKNQLQSFLMMETMSYVDHRILRQDSGWLGELSLIDGEESSSREKANALEATDEPNAVNKDAIHDWIMASDSQSLIIQRGGKILFEYYAPNIGEGEKLNGQSMTKTVIALLIGIAIDEGLIESEEQSLSDFLPELSIDESIGIISLRSMLRQESGMHDEFSLVFSSLKGEAIDLAEVEFQEDKRFVYSNVNYYLLSLVLRRLYQKDLSQILSDKLWKPMKLSNAGVINSTGYCCIFATARSWLALGELLMNKGVYKDRRIVSEAWVNKMINDRTQPKFFVVQLTNRGVANEYGYHIFSGLEDRSEAYWTEGIGFQLVFIDPNTELIIVRQGDISSASNLSGYRWHRHLLSDLLAAVDDTHSKSVE